MHIGTIRAPTHMQTHSGASQQPRVIQSRHYCLVGETQAQSMNPYPNSGNWENQWSNLGQIYLPNTAGPCHCKKSSLLKCMNPRMCTLIHQHKVNRCFAGKPDISSNLPILPSDLESAKSLQYKQL